MSANNNIPTRNVSDPFRLGNFGTASSSMPMSRPAYVQPQTVDNFGTVSSSMPMSRPAYVQPQTVDNFGTVSSSMPMSRPAYAQPQTTDNFGTVSSSMPMSHPAYLQPQTTDNFVRVPSSMPMSHPAYLQPQTQSQVPNGSHFQFQGLFQSPLRSQTLQQAQSQALRPAQTHQAQAQPAHAQFPGHLQTYPLAQIQNSGTGYGGASSPSLPTPGMASAKRVQQKPPTCPVPTNTYTTTTFQTMELTPAAQRKKRKLLDKQLPDRVATVLPESALYTHMLEFEARMDDALARKKIDIQESLKNPPCIQRTLRLYVFNTFANQSHTIPEKQNVEPPSWSLKIIGRILEDGVSDSVGVIQKPNSSYPKLSTFFKRITISLDPSLYPDNPTIVWENVRSSAPTEGFEIKRKGGNEFTAVIQLEMNYVPEKFKLSSALREVLGIEVDTRPRIIAAVWHYVKARKLQHLNDPSFFTCDPALQRVFGEERMKFSMLSDKISQHLATPHPITLEHKIKLSGNNPVGNTCYDILVDVPFPLQKEMSAFLTNAERHKEIDALDDGVSAAIKKIQELRRRRAFFLGFSQSPVDFINALIASQNRDLKLVAGEASRTAAKECLTDFYNQPWAEDAVIRYLNRKSAGN